MVAEEGCKRRAVPHPFTWRPRPPAATRIISAPAGSVDAALSYCHYTLADRSLEG